MRKIQGLGFTGEGVYFDCSAALLFYKRVIGSGGHATPSASVAETSNRPLYVKQYLPVGCVVRQDETGVLTVAYWFQGSPDHPLEEARDLTWTAPV